MTSKTPFHLSDKTILIVGASSGIGRAVACVSARMEAQIVACGRDIGRLESLLDTLGRDKHTYFAGDLTEQVNIENLVEEVPRLDGVVLSAGKGLTLPFQFSTTIKFEEIFKINFYSQIELLRLLVKKKKLKPNSSVVIVCSIGGVKKFSIGSSVYGASKAALNAMVKVCAIELASKKIRVNGVCPGMVTTPLIDRGTLTKEQFQADMELYPLKRYGCPEDVAYGIVYLLSDASSWVTGHSLVIDGGITAK